MPLARFGTRVQSAFTMGFDLHNDAEKSFRFSNTG